jgi:hypothetical protein
MLLDDRARPSHGEIAAERRITEEGEIGEKETMRFPPLPRLPPVNSLCARYEKVTAVPLALTISIEPPFPIVS